MTLLNSLRAGLVVRCVFPVILLGHVCSTEGFAGTPANKRIVSLAPAQKWEDAMVTGNGLLGTMHHGDPRDEVTVVNSHQFVVPNGAPFPIPDMSDQVDGMRDLMLAGKIGQGYQRFHDELLRRRGLKVKRKPYHGMVSSQGFHGGYQLQTRLDGVGDVKDYQRSTNYPTGEVMTRWTDDSGEWMRRSFASRSANVLVTEIAAPVGDVVSGVVSISKVPKTPSNIRFDVSANDQQLKLAVQYVPIAGRQAGFEGVTRVTLPDGGTSTADDAGNITIKDAPRVLLLTTVDRYREVGQRWEAGTLERFLNELPDSYQVLHQPHVKIQREMFNRVEFSLGSSEEELALDTTALLRKQEANPETINFALLEKVFYTSRYLFMASSGASYGPRLCGLFSGEWGAAWGGDYTCDSNVNMAVFGGGIVDLPECMEGYFQVLQRTKPQWREAAKNYWGCRGIVGPIRIDGEVAIPIHCGPYHAHFAATGLGPWLVYPMYEHYQITGDQEFLRTRVYPFLKEMAIFYEDFLTRRDQEGRLVFVPSNSPENAWPGIKPRTSAAINSTMDIAASKHSLEMLLKTEQILGVPASDQTKKWKQMLAAMPPYLINRDGALKEWSWKSIGENYSHRHSSHMYPVWPAYEINPDDAETRDLIPAVKVALKKRAHKVKQAHDGLQRSIAWLRVKEGEPFHQILKHFMTKGYFYDGLATSHDDGHHTYNYDLVLCLQGLLVETAVFTQPGLIEVLPAMPKAFGKGRLAGIKGRNQTTIDELSWDVPAGVVDVTITSRVNQTLDLVCRRGIKRLQSDAETSASTLGEHARQIKLKAGQPVSLTIEF